MIKYKNRPLDLAASSETWRGDMTCYTYFSYFSFQLRMRCSYRYLIIQLHQPPLPRYPHNTILRQLPVKSMPSGSPFWNRHTSSHVRFF
mmetsp:Transcript_30065/g.49783  ORF Transcript_30065/g.49783 Transcript_30065/m.49783 type:complete len:89 (-) Transcript_30065:407-673(-)